MWYVPCIFRKVIWWYFPRISFGDDVLHSLHKMHRSFWASSGTSKPCEALALCCHGDLEIHKRSGIGDGSRNDRRHSQTICRNFLSYRTLKSNSNITFNAYGAMISLTLSSTMKWWSKSLSESISFAATLLQITVECSLLHKYKSPTHYRPW